MHYDLYKLGVQQSRWVRLPYVNVVQIEAIVSQPVLLCREGKWLGGRGEFWAAAHVSDAMHAPTPWPRKNEPAIQRFLNFSPSERAEQACAYIFWPGKIFRNSAAVPGRDRTGPVPNKVQVSLNFIKAAGRFQGTQYTMYLLEGVELIDFPLVNDAHRGGSLSFGQYPDHLPFEVQRHFIVFGAPANSVRGAHAHHSCKQCLICVSGEIRVDLDNGNEVSCVLLSSPSQGLLIHELIWSSQTYVAPGSVLLVLASDVYCEDDYIRSYAEFQSLKCALDSERKAHVPFMDLRPSDGLRRSLLGACSQVITSGIYVNGPDVSFFEEEFAQFCKSSYCVGVGSGLDAIYLLLRAARLEQGTEIIVAANTYIATLLAISRAGFTPILVEPDPRTYNIDPKAVESALSEKTSAIFATDLYGQPANGPALREIADKCGIKVFCDAAQSHGSMCCDVPACKYYDATAYSFYPTKNLGAIGEAGAVVTDDFGIADAVRLLRNYGSRERYRNEVKGINARLDTLQAAFLRIKLRSLKDQNRARCELAKVYLEELKDVSWLGLPQTLPHVSHVWHLFVVTCTCRDALRSHLQSEGVDTIVHYPIPPHLSEAYSDLGFKRGSFPITERLADTVLSLPLGPHMSSEDAMAVISAIKRFRPPVDAA